MVYIHYNSNVRKFVGKEGAVPKLTRLGSNEWENTKKKIKNRINDMADKLYSLYLERQKVKGFAFLPDDEIQMEFENMFGVEVDEDALSEIKQVGDVVRFFEAHAK